ncbi:MAG: patatin family protein [Prevotella sp.]|nr:patatin family protein [Candidatus Prevotella equi]
MKTGLVLEGGGLRGLFTTGILDAMLDEGVTVDGMIGVSAGALFGCNYKSRQKGRALRYNVMLKDNTDYMGWRTFFKTGEIVSNEFSYHIVPFEIDKVDCETFKENPMEFWMVATDIERGTAVFHQMKEVNHYELDWMRASASMPVVSKPVCLDGKKMLDGGIINSIPLKDFQQMGYERNIVILTQPLGYFKKPTKLRWLFNMKYRKTFPKVAEMMAHRHEMYNAQLRYLMEQEKLGNTLLIYPEKPLGIGRTELNETKMRAVHSHGYNLGRTMMPKIKAFLQQ